MQNCFKMHPVTMMGKLVSILLILFSFSITAQLQKVEIDFDLMLPTITWEERDSIYFDLPIIVHSSYKNHFRVYLNGQTVDFISNDSVSYKAILTNDITEYKDVKNRKKRHKYIFEKIEFDKITSTKLALKILASGQAEIPTDTLIPSWNSWFFHCSGVKFHFKAGGLYAEKTYRCIDKQNDTICFIDIIKRNIQILQNELSLDSCYQAFISKLESGKTYSSDGYWFLSTLSTKPSKKVLRHFTRKFYFDSIIDTIDSFILSNIQTNEFQNEESCNMQYHITYSKNGKLKKVKMEKYYKPKLADGLDFYLEDVKTNRMCKKRIKQLFKKINLYKFNFKYPLDRIVDVSFDGSITLRDYTMW